MAAKQLYPLRFEPIFRRYLWGGRRLESHLGKQLGNGSDYAESWEVVDHGEDQSIVTAGSLSGTPLALVRRDHRVAVYGQHESHSQFPLLFKFLDAHRPLSVQVHPNDVQAAALDRPDLGKTEAWIVMHAEPGSLVYAGLKSGVDRDSLARAVQRGTTEECLQSFEPAVGDCVFIPAGTVHALGAGLVIAEIQQASDTTFRLSDWNRVGSDGQPRPLHVEQALAVIDYAAGPVERQVPQSQGPDVERLVSCDKFVLNRRRVTAPWALPDDDRFHLIVVLEGSLEIAGDPTGWPLGRAECTLVPARCGQQVRLDPISDAWLLDIHLPSPE